MHVTAFIGELQHFKNLKPSYLSTCKWEILGKSLFVRQGHTLGQAKLIIRFPFQGFQNSMRAGGHFSLFIMTKILRKQCKKLI